MPRRLVPLQLTMKACIRRDLNPIERTFFQIAAARVGTTKQPRQSEGTACSTLILLDSTAHACKHQVILSSRLSASSTHTD